MTVASQPQRVYASIDGYLIDCILTEDHSFESEVSEFPVESGPDVTDNIRPKPIEVTMKCIVSNSPIGAIVSSRQNAISSEFSGPADEAYERLLTIRDNRALVAIRTSLQEFKNMALKSLSIPRSSETGDAIEFTAVWVQVQLVENKRFVRVAIPMAQGDGTTNKPAIAVKPSQDQSRMVDMNGASGGHWWDPAIGFWRFGVLYNNARGLYITKVAEGVFDPVTLSPIRPWSLTKGRPIWITYADWQKHLGKDSETTDQALFAQWQQLSNDPKTSFLKQTQIDKYIVAPFMLLDPDDYFEYSAAGELLNG